MITIGDGVDDGDYKVDDETMLTTTMSTTTTRLEG